MALISFCTGGTIKWKSSGKTVDIIDIRPSSNNMDYDIVTTIGTYSYFHLVTCLNDGRIVLVDNSLLEFGQLLASMQ